MKSRTDFLLCKNGTTYSFDTCADTCDSEWMPSFACIFLSFPMLSTDMQFFSLNYNIHRPRYFIQFTSLSNQGDFHPGTKYILGQGLMLLRI